MNKTIFKDFSKYVSFNILGQIAYSCYTLADTFFVSADIGTNGLTALNLAFPVFCIISGTGLMLVLLFASIFLEKKNSFHLTIPNLVQMKRTTGNIFANGIPPFLTEAASGTDHFHTPQLFCFNTNGMDTLLLLWNARCLAGISTRNAFPDSALNPFSFSITYGSNDTCTRR